MTLKAIAMQFVGFTVHNNINEIYKCFRLKYLLIYLYNFPINKFKLIRGME